MENDLQIKRGLNMMTRLETHEVLKPRKTFKKGVFELFWGKYLSCVMQKKIPVPPRGGEIFSWSPWPYAKKSCPPVSGQIMCPPTNPRSPLPVNSGRSFTQSKYEKKINLKQGGLFTAVIYDLHEVS